MAYITFDKWHIKADRNCLCGGAEKIKKYAENTVGADCEAKIDR